MTCSLYVLLNNEAPAISNESLAKNLIEYFKNEEDFAVKLEQLPFAKDKSIALHWGSWLVRVAYEEGPQVTHDSLEIQFRLQSTTLNLSKINKSVRIVIGDDDKQQYTNQIIYLLDYFREINGTFIYDPQQNDVLN
jgi:hypothetical protein